MKRISSLRLSRGRQSRSKFYIAELVQECRIRGVKRSLVWVNIHLIRASSASEAYSKALKKGKEHDRQYRAGEEGRPARWIFRGIRELTTIHQKLADGAEIMFEAHEDVAPAAAERMVRPRIKLSAFQEERAQPDGTDNSGASRLRV